MTAVAAEPRVKAPPLGALRWRPSRAQLIGAGTLALVAAFPAVLPNRDFAFFVGAYASVYAMIGLSVVVVTGYAGLCALMPYSFAGIGAMVTGLSMASWGWPFWLAVPLAAVATAPVALLVGVASVRLKGLYLAIATLTLANALGETFFRWGAVTGGSAGWTVTRPTAGPVDFGSDAAFYVLALGSVLLLVWMIHGLRHARTGRAMVAVRDNEVEAQALGINVYKTKLVTLLIGGMLAGVGGAFLAALQVAPTAEPFRSPISEATSFLLVATVAIGGVDRALGAFIGAVALVVQQQVFAGAEFFYPFFGIYTGLLLIVLLKFRPGGLLQIARMQGEMIRRRPAVGIPVTAGVLGLNVGLAYLILRLS